jgi:hypothetical protein
VHGLERDLGAAVGTLWLNVDEAAGARARQVYGVGKVPAVILLDQAGREVYRTEGKLPRVRQIRGQLASLSSDGAGDDGVDRG